MSNDFARRFQYTAWADRKILEALRGRPEAQVEGLPLIAHVLGAEHIWLSRLRGVAPTSSIQVEPSIDACENLIEANETGYREWIASLGEHGARRPLRYRNLQGIEYVDLVGDILNHVVIHGAYHRGQIAKAIGRSGGTAPGTDYITFAREHH